MFDDSRNPRELVYQKDGGKSSSKGDQQKNPGCKVKRHQNFLVRIVKIIWGDNYN
jgi:hypothetical protein